jgi:hypothetical protein
VALSCRLRPMNLTAGVRERTQKVRAQTRRMAPLSQRSHPTLSPTRPEQEAARRPEVERLMAHPGVGSLTALPLVLIIGTPQ